MPSRGEPPGQGASMRGTDDKQAEIIRRDSRGEVIALGPCGKPNRSLKALWLVEC
jgi:hypothetical protein